MKRVYKNDKFKISIFFSIFVYLIFDVFFYLYFRSKSITPLVFSTLHISMVLFLFWRFTLTLYNYPKTALHPFNFFIFEHIIYFSINFFKYYHYPNYFEFTTDLDYRFIGTFLVFVSLNILILFFEKIFKYEKINIFDFFSCEIKKKYFYYFVSTISIVIGFLIILLVYFDAEKNHFSGLLINTFPVFLLLSIFVYSEKRNFLNVFIIIFGLTSVFFGSGVRHVLFYAFIIISLFYIAKNLNRDKLRGSRGHIFNIVVYIPLFIIILIQPVTEFVKEGKSGDLIRYVNRADLSDFAISVSIENDQIAPLFYIVNSFKWAIPGPFIDKSCLDYSIEKFLNKKGWRSSDYRIKYTLYNVDYPDTLFSTGAFIGGYVGMVFFPVFWIYLFNLLFKKMNKKFFIASFLAIVPIMFKIEIAPWEIIPMFRNFLVTIVFFFIVLKIFTVFFSNRIKTQAYPSFQR